MNVGHDAYSDLIPAPSSVHRILAAPGLANELSASHRSLISQAFADYEVVYIRRMFVSGYSGASVFLVSAGPHQPPTVVKLAHPLELYREYQAYQQYVSRISPQDIAHIRGEPLVAEDGQLGVIQYTFVGGSDTSPAISLHDYYLEYGAAAASDVLNRIFRVFGRHWWANHRSDIYALGEHYDCLLTAHLQIVRVANPVGAPVVLGAGEASTLSLRTLQVGQFVQVRSFEVAKAHGAKLTLSAPPPPIEAAAPLRIKVDTTERLVSNPGDHIEQVDGVVTATRQTVLNGIAQTILPDFQPDDELFSGPSAEEAKRQHDIQLLNPLYGLDALLDRMMESRISVIHGDLNLQNVLVDSDTGFAWLIDFAETREGPAVFDLQRLEVQVLTKLLPPAVAEAGLGRECVIDLLAALHWDPPQQNAPHASLAEPYALLVTIRRLARQYLVDDLQWDEYYLGLAAALVGALKYEELDDLARGLAFFGAATVRGLVGNPLNHDSAAPSDHAETPGEPLPADTAVREDTPRESEQQFENQVVDTGGGTYIGGNVDTGGGDFAGRDKVIGNDEVRGDKTTGGVRFGDVQGDASDNLIAGGDIAGGVHTRTTRFDQRGQKVKYQYNAAGDINLGAVQDQVDLVRQLENLQAEIARAVDGDALDEETGIDVQYRLQKAVQQAKKPEPDTASILDYLNEAKDLVVKVAADAGALGGLISGLTQAIALVQKLF